jgi:hypothetical protein
MNTVAISFVVFGFVFGGAIVGMLLRRFTPESFLSGPSSDIIKLVTGLIITMSSLVLGMLVSSSKAAYDSQKNDLAQVSAQMLSLDRVLASYGPEAGNSRAQLGDLVKASLDRVWPEKRLQRAELTPTQDAEEVLDQVLAFSPQTEAQELYKSEAIRMATDLRQARWLVFVESGQMSVPIPVLIVLVSWLTAIFISFGFLAPRNPAVIITLVVCAIAASAAIFIILALNAPFEGVLKISDAPLRAVLSEIGK